MNPESDSAPAIRAGASPLDLAERLKDVWNRLTESERGPDLLVIIDELSALSTASPLRLEPIKRRVERNYGGGEAWRTSGEMKDVIALLAEVEALRQRLLAAEGARAWVNPVRELVAKLDVILPIVDGYIAFSHLRSGTQYTGPNIVKELAAVKELLQAPALLPDETPESLVSPRTDTPTGEPKP